MLKQLLGRIASVWIFVQTVRKKVFDFLFLPKTIKTGEVRLLCQDFILNFGLCSAIEG